MLAAIPTHARRLRADEEGSVTVEAVIVLPILFSLIMALLVFFDAFRAESISVKAAYTISDVLSREEPRPITPAFMDGLDALHDLLVTDDAGRRLRVTAFEFIANGAGAGDDAYRRAWSRSRGGVAEHTDATFALLRDRLPTMTDGQVAVLTETWVDHVPAFDALEPFTYADFVVTARRSGGRLCWHDQENGDPLAAVC